MNTVPTRISLPLNLIAAALLALLALAGFTASSAAAAGAGRIPFVASGLAQWTLR